MRNTATGEGPRAITGTVVRVSDGDSLVIRDKGGASYIVRLTDIDAPEASHGQGRPGQPFSAKATAHLKDLALGAAADAACYEGDVRQDQDSPARVRHICRVHVAGKDLSLSMVDAGLAMANRQNSRYVVRDQAVYSHEDQAKRQKAGVIRLEELRGQAEGLRQSGSTSPTAVQELADLDAVVANLDIRIGNLRAMQQSALQTLPQIRVIQTSNQVLVDKFHTIREVTVPAWKRQFMLALGLNEQRNAVELADKIDDTTNELLKRNADLLKRNATQTAQANQRLVIDIATLQHVQNSLISTVEDVIKIHRDGALKRQEAERSIETMRRDLQAKLTSPEAKATAA